jgi:hypothetical protein
VGLEAPRSLIAAGSGSRDRRTVHPVGVFAGLEMLIKTRQTSS